MRTVPKLLSAVGCVLLAGLGSLATAQETQPTADALAQQVRADTTPLQDLLSQYQATSDLTLQADLLAQMVSVARARTQALESLLPLDTQLAFTLAFSPEQLTQFPETIRPELEMSVTLEGMLEVLIEDHLEEGISHTHHILVIGQTRYSLYFHREAPALLSGSQVRVTGLRVGTSIVVP